MHFWRMFCRAAVPTFREGRPGAGDGSEVCIPYVHGPEHSTARRGRHSPEPTLTSQADLTKGVIPMAHSTVPKSCSSPGASQPPPIPQPLPAPPAARLTRAFPWGGTALVFNHSFEMMAVFSHVWMKPTSSHRKWGLRQSHLFQRVFFFFLNEKAKIPTSAERGNGQCCS